MESDPSRDISPTVIEHARRPRNNGVLSNFNGHACITGACGDIMEFWLLVEDDIIKRVRFISDGCGFSDACGSMAACLAEGKSIADAAVIGQQDILSALGGLPQEVEHCALLAANTLKAACDDYVRGKTRRPEKAQLSL
jgi:nitrogen fixation NifU-like protein